MKIPNISSIKGLIGIGKAFAMAHRPELLLGASLVSGIGATGLAARGGYKAGQKVLQTEFDELDLVSEEGKTNPLSTKEKALLTWEFYVPAALALTTNLGTTAGLHFVHVKDKKALVATSLAAMDELKKEFTEYMDDVEKAVDPHLTDNQRDKVRDELLSKQADKYEDGHARVMNTDGVIEELYLVRDPISARDIWSNRTRIEQAMVEIGNVINASENADLNMFYSMAGWGETKSGNKVGWSGVIPEVSWVDGSGPIGGVRDDGRPFVSFRFRPEPSEDFDAGA